MAAPKEMRYFSTRGGSETLSFEEVSGQWLELESRL
jgi:hypothetical protein